jgi:hypothetical protein
MTTEEEVELACAQHLARRWSALEMVTLSKLKR